MTQTSSDDRLLMLLAMRDRARDWECWRTYEDLNARIAEEAAKLAKDAA